MKLFCIYFSSRGLQPENCRYAFSSTDVLTVHQRDYEGLHFEPKSWILRIHVLQRGVEAGENRRGRKESAAFCGFNIGDGQVDVVELQGDRHLCDRLTAEGERLLPNSQPNVQLHSSKQLPRISLD